MANDPNFNLRYDPVLIHRKEDVTETLYASVVESHGRYSTISEIPVKPYSDIKQIVVLQADENYSVVSLSDNNDNSWLIGISNKSSDDSKKHNLHIRDKKLDWIGPYTISKNKKI